MVLVVCDGFELALLGAKYPDLFCEADLSSPAVDRERFSGGGDPVRSTMPPVSWLTRLTFEGDEGGGDFLLKNDEIAGLY